MVSRVDIDKLMLKRLKVVQLRKVAGPFVDLCNACPRVTSEELMGCCCIVQSPVCVYVEAAQRAAVLAAMQQQTGRCLLPSPSDSKLLGNATPLKSAVEDVMLSLARAGVVTVTTLVFGQKMSLEAAREMNFADFDPGTEVSLDVGLSYPTPRGIPLVRAIPNVQWGFGPRSLFPVLVPQQQAMRRDEEGPTDCGTLFVQIPGGQPVQKAKIYPGLTHVLKGAGCQNLENFPRDIQSVKYRLVSKKKILWDITIVPGAVC